VLPWMASCEENVWIDVTFDLDTMTEVHDAGPNDNWNAYLLGMTEVLDKDGDEVVEDGTYEVPFWAMLAFFDRVARGKKKTGQVTLSYRRKSRDGKNFGEFK